MAALVASMTGDHPARPVLVVSNVAGAGGLERARAAGVPTAVVDHRDHARRKDFDAALTETLRDAGAELICLAGFMRILTPGFVADWRGRVLNIHPSLLPKYPGRDTHARAIAAGDVEHGCTVHVVTADLDAGPVLGQAQVPILSGDTPATLAARLAPVEHALYVRTLARVAAKMAGAGFPLPHP